MKAAKATTTSRRPTLTLSAPHPNKAASPSYAACIARMIRTEGLVHSYRGAAFNASSKILCRSVMFKVTEHTSAAISNGSDSKPSIAQLSAAAAFAGVVEGGLSTPSENIRKVGAFSPGKIARQLVVETIKREGIAMFIAAMPTRIATTVIFNLTFFNMLRITANICPRGETETQQLLLDFGRSLFSSAAAAASSGPADALHSRLIKQAHVSGTPRFGGAIAETRQAFAREGYHWMQKGLKGRCTRVGGGMAITTTAYYALERFWDRFSQAVMLNTTPATPSHIKKP